MKKLFIITLTMILIVSCGKEKSLSEEQINSVVNIVESDGIKSIQNKELSELELEFAKCFRQCRRTFKANKPPLKITIGEGDLKKYKVSGVEYNRKSVTDSDVLYNAYISIVRAHCIDGCILKQPFAEKASKEYDKFNETYVKLVKAKEEIEKAKQAEAKKNEVDDKKKDKKE